MIYWQLELQNCKLPRGYGLKLVFSLVITEFVLLTQTPPFYEVNSLIENGERIEEFQKYFSRPLFTIIFRPEMLKFHPYSILTGDTMVGFVIFCVLKR